MHLLAISFFVAFQGAPSSKPPERDLSGSWQVFGQRYDLKREPAMEESGGEPIYCGYFRDKDKDGKETTEKLCAWVTKENNFRIMAGSVREDRWFPTRPCQASFKAGGTMEGSCTFLGQRAYGFTAARAASLGITSGSSAPAGTPKIEEAEARKYFDQHKSEFTQSMRARHILIRMTGSRVPIRPGQKNMTPEEALAKAEGIRRRILAGEDFATVAKAESDDPGSGSIGGDLGTFKRGQMVSEFEQGAFALSVGEVSQPISTEFGYHIIKVESKEAGTFDDVRGEILRRLRQ